jgi:K+-transporting ATPase KdpF subunit
MNPLYWIGLVLFVVLTAYLLYAMLGPEKF